LFPHLQWDKVWQMWQTFYPIDDLPADKKAILTMLDEEEKNFVQLVLSYTSKILKGKQLAQIFPYGERQPIMLQQLFQAWKKNKDLIENASPTMVFAVLGQAKFDQAINAVEENKLLTQQLRNWAYKRK
jgi:hypothetical protein